MSHIGLLAKLHKLGDITELTVKTCFERWPTVTSCGAVGTDLYARSKNCSYLRHIVMDAISLCDKIEVHVCIYIYIYIRLYTTIFQNIE